MVCWKKGKEGKTSHHFLVEHMTRTSMTKDLRKTMSKALPIAKRAYERTDWWVSIHPRPLTHHIPTAITFRQSQWSSRSLPSNHWLGPDTMSLITIINIAQHKSEWDIGRTLNQNADQMAMKKTSYEVLSSSPLDASGFIRRWCGRRLTGHNVVFWATSAFFVLVKS